jgi:inositol-phosphate phosphatase/L-galactose 1-phosphate phosphatase/histidinol-phosphatase
MGAQADCPGNCVDLAEGLAAAAREITLEYFRTGVTVDAKADASPVTVADRRAEARMRELIEDRFPGHGIIGEEYGATRDDAEYVWVLDPIDGTKAFITGNPLFGTLIALTRNGHPILGIIDMPALGERWTGIAGQPTQYTDYRGTRDAEARACPMLEQAVLRCTSPHMLADSRANEQAFDRVRQRTRLALYGGDCYCYGQVASGFADLVVEAGLGVYDFMALLPVVEGAGGLARDWEGQELGFKSDGRVVFAGDAALMEAALAVLKG